MNLGGGGGGQATLKGNMLTSYHNFMSVCTHAHVLILQKLCNLDAIIYNKITSIVNVIRLKLFTLISIVNKHLR